LHAGLPESVDACVELFKGIRMKKIVYAAFTSAAALALAACGGSEKAPEEGASGSSESMAEEAVSDQASPAADASAEAGATDEASDAAGAADEGASEGAATE